jgi:recombination protein RecA
VTDKKELVVQEAARLERKYGYKSGAVASTRFDYDVIPSGIMALDYALGIGGWPANQMVEVFGLPDIGKSSLLGLNAIKSAQTMNKLCGIVALEPNIDDQWLEKNGVDPELVAIGRPNDGNDAFEMAYDWATGGVIDFIVFDSIGALLNKSEVEEDGNNKAYGQSGLITFGTKRLLMPCWKNNVGVMLINQVRDDTKAKYAGVLDSPGGHAMKHGSGIRVQIKPGRERFTVKEGGNDVLVGQEVYAVVKRNKNNEGTNQRAIFNYFHKETDQYPFGVDIAQDVINTGIMTGVLKKNGAWITHHSFPPTKKGDNQLQGKQAVQEFIVENPKVVNTIRNEVIEVMKQERVAKNNGS